MSAAGDGVPPEADRGAQNAPAAGTGPATEPEAQQGPSTHTKPDAADGQDQPRKIRVESTKRIRTVRLTVWVLFGVIIALLPLIAVGIKDAMSAEGFHLCNVLVDGELFVVSAVLAAGALGELLGAAYRTGLGLVVVFAGFGCFATFAGNMMCYMVVADSLPGAVVEVSVWLFALTLIPSGVAIGTAAGR